MFSDLKATERFMWIINSAMDTSLCRRLLRSRISGVFFRLDVPISSAGMCRYRQLSICNRFSFFLPRFPDIPQKISAYLLTGFPSGANTRKIRSFYKILDINDLYSRDISSHCKKHHFGLWNRPFRRLKCTISHSKMGLIGAWNGQYQNARRAFPDYDMGYIRRQYG